MNTLTHAAARADDLIERSAVSLRNHTHQLQEGAVQARERTAGYIRDEPFKSMLIAAAGGALLMAVARMASRRRRMA